MLDTVVVIRGGGDIATAIAYKLHRCGFKVLLLEIEKPQVIRLKAAFALAVYEGNTSVEGISAVYIEKEQEIIGCWKRDVIPVMIDPECKILDSLKADVLIDSILAKKNLGMKKSLAPLTVALGPGFEAGKDVHVVIETQRGHNLGRIIYNGTAAKNTGIPGIINGYSSERVLRAPADGVIMINKSIGDMVTEGEVIAHIKLASLETFSIDQRKASFSVPLKASISGVIRGLIYDGFSVSEGMKIGDIDPRGEISYCNTISDKGRTIAGAAVEAIMAWENHTSKEN